MASGFGWGGGRSRCFTYWQEFQKCYAQADSPTECQTQNADYLECLHHPKEIQRAHAVQAEYVRQVQHQGKTVPTTGGPTDISLLQHDKKDESKGK